MMNSVIESKKWLNQKDKVSLYYNCNICSYFSLTPYKIGISGIHSREIPLSSNLYCSIEGHSKTSHEKVGHGQRDQKIIVDMSQFVVSKNGHNYQ